MSRPWHELRTTAEGRESMLVISVENMKKGWTDNGIRRELLSAKIYKADDAQHLKQLQEHIDEARLRCGIPDPDIPDMSTAPIIATPYIWTDPKDIPQRDWIYGRLLIRQFASLTIAPGGVGKSSLTVVEMLAMISGFKLLDAERTSQLRVWMWNLEDPQAETMRKIQAAAKHYNLATNDIGDRLFVNSGRDQPLVIATSGRDGVTIVRPVVDSLIAQIKENDIDVLIVDPFVSCHEASENDNSAIDAIAKEWSRIADLGNCAVHLVHHTRKAQAGSEVTAESARGAKALTDAVRVARAINQMTEAEAKTAGVENAGLYFRAYNDKQNLAPPAAKSDWYKLESIPLGNGTFGTDGDLIGVVTSWRWPDPVAGIKDSDFDKVAKVIRSGKWRKDPQATAWAGKAVAQALALDLDDKAGKAKAAALLKFWIKTGELVVEVGEDEKRMLRDFVVVAEGGGPKPASPTTLF